MKLWLWAALALMVWAAPAAAVDEDELLPIEQAFVLTARAVERGRIEFHFKIAPGYYLYRHRMSAAAADSGFKFNPLELPPGKRYTDEFFGEVETYRDEVTAVLTGAAADGVTAMDFQVKYQGCADIGICYPPHRQTVRVELPAAPALAALPAAGSGLALPGAATGGGLLPLPGATPVAATSNELPLPEAQAFAFEAIVASPNELLLRFTPHPGYYLYRDRSSFRIEGEGIGLGAPRWPPAMPHHDEHFGDVAVYFDQAEVPLPLGRSDGAAQTITLVATFQGCQTDGICYSPMTRRVELQLPPAGPDQLALDSAPPPPLGVANLASAVLLALLGGLILNLMPCVLPVLSLKLLGLAGSGDSTAKARAHALWYSVGVLLSFAVVGAAALALRQAGLALGWGFQLQQPLVVASLVYVMLLVGLSLSGVFQIGAGLAGVGQSLTEHSGARGDFFTGVLAVVVATPCTAPFMGGALAYAFTAPPLLALLVFLALGLGLALPFLLAGFVPALARLLPRPGAWMETFKQVLAFPMYLTAVWLAWVLAKQRGADAIGAVLVGAVALAAAAWAFDRWQRQRRSWAALFALLALAAAAGMLGYLDRLPAAHATTAAATSDASEPYSAARLAELRRQGRVVFVNMTADWCVTCKANEKAVLSQPAFQAALSAADAVYLKGDWTNVDPAITAFLEEHGAYGVPLYVVFSGEAEAVKLPTVLTAGTVEEALSAAGR